MTAVLAMPISYPTAAGPVPMTDHGGVHLLPVPLHDARTDRGRSKAGKFRPRAMYKDELAAWYGVSRRTFTRSYLPPLMTKLRKKGYTPTLKLLSLAMVNIIVAHHDWPGD